MSGLSSCIDVADCDCFMKDCKKKKKKIKYKYIYIFLPMLHWSQHKTLDKKMSIFKYTMRCNHADDQTQNSKNLVIKRTQKWTASSKKTYVEKFPSCCTFCVFLNWVDSLEMHMLS